MSQNALIFGRYTFARERYLQNISSKFDNIWFLFARRVFKDASLNEIKLLLILVLCVYDMFVQNILHQHGAS